MSKTESQRVGWLTKEGENFKTWKKRWFELRDGILTYAKNEAGEAVSSIVLDATDVVSEDAGKKGKKFSFGLVTARRTYYLQADSEAEMKSWMSALKTAIAGVRDNAHDEVVDGKPMSKIGMDDFDLLKVIGKGSFGQVIQVCKKDTKRIYAMKVMNKKTIVEKNDTEHIKAERRILQRVRHPFLMTLHMSFQTPDKLYLVMDFVNGGELFTHMQAVENFDEPRTRFYVAEITLGLEYLHKMGIIYRDLKPENILLTSAGHICLTDFGISKEGFEKDEVRTKTLVGTPEYLAPEVLEGKAYGKEVDWWSLGTLMFEMLDGNPPFWDQVSFLFLFELRRLTNRMLPNKQDVQKMYRRILSEPLTVFPPAAGPSAIALLRCWLERDPKKRLCDGTLIKQHEFFAGLNWEDLYNLKVKPTYVPPVKDNLSTAMIDPSFTSESVASATAPSATSPMFAAHFDGFTYDAAAAAKAQSNSSATTTAAAAAASKGPPPALPSK